MKMPIGRLVRRLTHLVTRVHHDQDTIHIVNNSRDKHSYFATIKYVNASMFHDDMFVVTSGGIYVTPVLDFQDGCIANFVGAKVLSESELEDDFMTEINHITNIEYYGELSIVKRLQNSQTLKFVNTCRVTNHVQH